MRAARWVLARAVYATLYPVALTLDLLDPVKD